MSYRYGLAGERRLLEVDLPWLPGHEGSRPAHIGNAAHLRRQFDVFGEAVDVGYLARRVGLKPRDVGWSLQRALVEFLESVWDQLDDGIWEMRGPRRQFTHLIGSW